MPPDHYGAKGGVTPATAILASLDDLGAPLRRLTAVDVDVMLAESRTEPFSRPGWLFELKYDGYRIVTGRRESDVVLLSRSKRPLTTVFPEIAKAVSALPYDDFVMDGEVVVCDANGRPNFQKLQKRGCCAAPSTSGAQHPSCRLPSSCSISSHSAAVICAVCLS
jgi:bifunctional non-homologous end joining protein LigD